MVSCLVVHTLPAQQPNQWGHADARTHTHAPARTPDASAVNPIQMLRHTCETCAHTHSFMGALAFTHITCIRTCSESHPNVERGELAPEFGARGHG